MWPKDIEPAVDDNGETHCFENLRVIHEEIAGKPSQSRVCIAP